ncbi:MAG: TIGR00730 family Rossman fold protein [Candidatus Eremiobacteraeota bacterium]|nr:TIGR00730 family Rossman fold protein [Candidatus Eremiobacteraeota bacterium]
MKAICVFCGSHLGNDPAYATMARHAAETIVRGGYAIVYGGGSIGLMGVVADAALQAGGDVIGVIPQALARTEVAHEGLTELHLVNTMHERKALMEDRSDAFVALPGGFGTMDEFCEILSWRQLRIHDKPIGLLNYGGYYDSLLRLFDSMVTAGFIGPHTRRLFADEDTIEQLLPAMFEPKNLP